MPPKRAGRRWNMSEAIPISSFARALPFWLSLSLLGVVFVAGWFGGLALLAVPIYAFGVMSLLDAALGIEHRNADTETNESLLWYKLITWIWLPLQVIAVFGALWVVCRTDHLPGREGLYLMLALGVVSGAIGIVYAHELMHQKNKFERKLGEWLMISVLYGHFVTEHLHVHHTHVATPKDVATARYNESLYRFFVRVFLALYRGRIFVPFGCLLDWGLDGRGALSRPCSCGHSPA